MKGFFWLSGILIPNILQTKGVLCGILGPSSNQFWEFGLLWGSNCWAWPGSICLAIMGLLSHSAASHHSGDHGVQRSFCLSLWLCHLLTALQDIHECTPIHHSPHVYVHIPHLPISPIVGGQAIGGPSHHWNLWLGLYQEIDSTSRIGLGSPCPCRSQGGDLQVRSGSVPNFPNSFYLLSRVLGVQIPCPLSQLGFPPFCQLIALVWKHWQAWDMRHIAELID